MTEYVFWWIARPNENETEEVMYFSTAQQARAYAAKLLRTEIITQYGKGYWHNPNNKIPHTAKIVDVITSKGFTTIMLFKNKLYAVRIRKNIKGEPYQVFYPMAVNGKLSDKSVKL